MGSAGSRRLDSGRAPARLRCLAVVAFVGALLGPSSAMAFAGHLGAGSSPLVTSGLPAGNSWTQAGPPPRPEPFARAYAAIAFDRLAGDGVVFGGRSVGGTTLNDTWVNDGDFPGSWVDKADDLTVSPPPLTNASLAYDRSDGYYVLFGGEFANGTASGQTWEFLGLDTWVDVTAFQAQSPPAQAGAGLAFDEADNTTVLFSGVGNVGLWTFERGNWSAAPYTKSPLPRSGEAFAYDPADRAIFLFGGSGNGTIDETWEWSGGIWRDFTPASSPPESLVPRAAYDPHGSGMLLYLGDRTESTWEFANATWTNVAVEGTDTPSPRLGAQLYFDSIVNHDILFGGIAVTNGSILSDDWGWAVPAAPVDSTLFPIPLSTTEVGGLAVVIAVPVALAWFLRRRPPRRLPVSVPRAASRASGI
ncbi:MAG: hypothetical protein L3K01_00720 [Thermoplasmata archaeon]|nr:hypothetical protein [Thermoplasmata archaeon]MCI4367664.1 hypothetical protein [Thermoplasmata archaeon]